MAWNQSQQVLIIDPVASMDTSPKPTKFTLAMVSGKRLCLKNVPITHHHLCADQARVPGEEYIAATTDG